MLNERVLRTALFVIVAALHALAIFFLAFTVSAKAPRPPENARVMKLFDLAEAPPPPPPPARLSPPPRAQEVPRLESIAETMIETDPPPEQAPAAAGTLAVPGEAPAVAAADDYLPMHMLSQPPRFDEKKIAADLVYPEIARRSGVEGRVILELVVDRHGVVQQALILQENPPGRGFGEAAVKAFIGKKGSPAMANGQEVSTRYRYPVSFRIK